MTAGPQKEGSDARSEVEALPWEDLRRTAERVLRRNLVYEPPEVIEDKVQECVVKLLRRVRSEEVGDPTALLATIARRTAIDLIRERHRWSLIQIADPGEDWDPADPIEPAPDSFEDPVARVRFAAFHFFRTTDTGCSDLARNFLDERDWSEVAEQQGRNATAVRKQWSRCLEKLRNAIRTLPEFSPLRELFGTP